MSGISSKYDIIIIGGGHAGIEASLASARMGINTLLITMNKKSVGRMSCNPAIGGLAKGHLVKEIDALGGEMAKIIDDTGIQFRMLNRSKGPAVWSPRAQADRELYAESALQRIEAQDNLNIFEGMVIKILFSKGVVTAVKISTGEIIETKSVILTAGTFLNGLIHIGMRSFPSGRIDEEPAVGLTECLVEMGHTSGRFKTGTPPRIDGQSVHWEVTTPQDGDVPPIPFSYQTESIQRNQVPCFLTYTNERTHEILRNGLERSPLYSGKIKSLGPRYCPSVETKIVRFPDKNRHQIFLEPEGLNTTEYYVNGFSTSLPEDVQEEGLRTITGLESVKIVRFGYAIEYDYFPPNEIKSTMESRILPGVFLAGQICGTSGYEEAASQGLIAGINAVLRLEGKDPFILERSQAYIGVMIDDLVTCGVDEPYRMFTSRAEYRLLLRQDNADERLMKYGKNFNLIGEEQFRHMEERRMLVQDIISKAKKRSLKPEEINPILISSGSSSLDKVESLFQIMKRPEITITSLIPIITGMDSWDNKDIEQILPKVEMETRYEGYILRQQEQIEKSKRWESAIIPEEIDYRSVTSLSTEAKEKLNFRKPRSIGQTSRIPGVTPADISVLLIYMKRMGWLKNL